jgi:hypothetical protein
MKQGKWVVNHGMLQTLVTSYGYFIHNLYPPENRRAIVFYDRTTKWKAGGNGKSLLAKSFRHIKPWHFVEMKQEKSGNNRFLMSGFTPAPLIRHGLANPTPHSHRAYLSQSTNQLPNLLWSGGRCTSSMRTWSAMNQVHWW